MNRIVAILLLLVCLPVFLFSQTEPANSNEPKPYEKDEFSTWQKDVRRAGIITFGALPFSTFFTAIYYDLYRYYDNDQDDRYLPWPLKNNDIAEPLTEDEQKQILAISIGASVCVALIDFTVRAIKRSAKRRKAERLERDRVETIRIEEIDGAVPLPTEVPPSSHSDQPEQESESSVNDEFILDEPELEGLSP
ncbi:MAG TPA: hypothetical protein PKH81_00680 [Treponemataceae bacterium]|nr:hypothetical protein [Treponemataceae bacterium]